MRSNGDGIVTERDAMSRRGIREEEDASEGRERGLIAEGFELSSRHLIRYGITFSTWIAGKSPWNIVLIKRS